jgi:DNA-binding response OmpR family regulator
MLTKAQPDLVSAGELYRAVWGGHSPMRSFNTLRVMITDLRIKLTALNAKIQSKRSMGYRLVLEDNGPHR